MPKKNKSKKTNLSSTSLLSNLSKNRPITLFWISITLFGISIVLLGFSVISQNSTKGPFPFAGYPAGTSIAMGSSITEVQNVTDTNGTGIFIAPKGKHYIVVTLKVKNVSEKPINVFPSSDTYVKNNAGNVSFLTPLNLTLPFRAGSLLPGENIVGELSYLVNNNETNKFYVDSIWSGGVIVFAVS